MISGQFVSLAMNQFIPARNSKNLGKDVELAELKR